MSAHKDVLIPARSQPIDDDHQPSVLWLWPSLHSVMIVDVHTNLRLKVFVKMGPPKTVAIAPSGGDKSNKPKKITPSCNIQGCRNVDPTLEKLECACGELDCHRLGHTKCYVSNILNDNRCHFKDSWDPSHDEPPARIACSVKCYRKCYRKYFVNSSACNVPWSKDGAGGPDDANNSEAILIEWLREPGNYSKFRSPPNGLSKASFCERISQRINSAGIVKERDASAVKSKIESIEQAFGTAHDWPMRQVKVC